MTKRAVRSTAKRVRKINSYAGCDLLQRCVSATGLSLHQLRKLGNFGVTADETRVEELVVKFSNLMQQPQPEFVNLEEAASRAIALVERQQKRASRNLKKRQAVELILGRIQSNSWWWTNIPVSSIEIEGSTESNAKFIASRMLSAMSTLGILQRFGQRRGSRYRIGPVIASDPQLCQHSLLVPSQKKQKTFQQDFVTALKVIDSAPETEGLEIQYHEVHPLQENSPQWLAQEQLADIATSHLNQALICPGLPAYVKNHLRKAKQALMQQGTVIQESLIGEK